MTDSLCLLPAPRQLIRTAGVYPLADQRLIWLDVPNPAAWRGAVARWQKRLQALLGLNWEITASGAVPDQIGVEVRLATHARHAEAYELAITPAGIYLSAADEAGGFYGLCTLTQILEQAGRQLPCLRISDWPDFPARGVMLDISRDKVPTLETVCALVDRLAGWKINQFQLYTEHTFAYRRHPEVWAEASPFTGQEILELDAFCRERHVELVPNQNSFGHMTRWFKHPRYQALAETLDEIATPWWPNSPRIPAGGFSLCPLDPGSLALMTGLYDELLPHFSSRLFNIGCDEAVDVGLGRSQSECAQRGQGRVYLDFVLSLYRDVRARGRRLQFWGESILHHPELIPDLPRDLIALEWGYEANHPFDAHCAQFAAAGIPFYVCPGTSSWCSIAGRTDNALGNLRSAAENGLKHGAVGYLITDWGDGGHWQVLPVSYLGYAAGAAYAWAFEANRSLDLARAVGIHALHDVTGRAGEALYALGNVYQAIGFEPDNASALWQLMQQTQTRVREYEALLQPEVLNRTMAAIDAAGQLLASAEMSGPEADLIRRELDQTAQLLRHAVRLAQFMLGTGERRGPELDRELQEIITVHEQLWLARNRPGGLTDSVARFEVARQVYRA